MSLESVAVAHTETPRSGPRRDCHKPLPPAVSNGGAIAWLLPAVVRRC